MDEIFRSGTLEMSSIPLEVLETPLRWSDVLTNRILIIVSMVLIMHHLLDLFRLTPPLLYSYSRSRGAEALEQSLGTARVRNMIALSLTLPFCLILDRFQALRPAYMDAVPAAWSVPVTIGLSWLTSSCAPSATCPAGSGDSGRRSPTPCGTTFIII